MDSFEIIISYNEEDKILFIGEECSSGCTYRNIYSVDEVADLVADYIDNRVEEKE